MKLEMRRAKQRMFGVLKKYYVKTNGCVALITVIKVTA